MPEHVGFPLFHSEGAQAIQVEIHYDNPTLIEGMVDSSGVRLYYINEEREEKAAILELGDSLIGLEGENINAGLTRYQFTCLGECSANVGSGSVTILNEYLHVSISYVLSYCIFSYSVTAISRVVLRRMLLILTHYWIPAHNYIDASEWSANDK